MRNRRRPLRTVRVPLYAVDMDKQTAPRATAVATSTAPVDDARFSLPGSIAGLSAELLPISLGQLKPSPFNARRYFDPESLQSLASSLKTDGQLQPIVVRKALEENEAYEELEVVYQIIAGERRYRAAQLAGLEYLNAFVVIVNDADMRRLMLTENLQRDDITPWEELTGVLAVLIDSFEDSPAWAKTVADTKGDPYATAAKVVRLAARALPEPPMAAANLLMLPVDDVSAALNNAFSVGVGLSGFARYRLGMLNWPDDVRQVLNEGAIPFTYAAPIASIADEARRADVLAAAREGSFANLAALRAAIDTRAAKNGAAAPDEANAWYPRVATLTTSLRRIERTLNRNEQKRIERLVGELEEAVNTYSAKYAEAGKPRAA